MIKRYILISINKYKIINSQDIKINNLIDLEDNKTISKFDVKYRFYVKVAHFNSNYTLNIHLKDSLIK